MRIDHAERAHGVDHRHQAAEQQRSAEYAAAARQSVVTLMSLDFNKAKEDVQRIIDNSTGQFRDDFKNQAEDFIKVAQDSKVITEVTVNATARRIDDQRLGRRAGVGHLARHQLRRGQAGAALLAAVASTSSVTATRSRWRKWSSYRDHQ